MKIIYHKTAIDKIMEEKSADYLDFLKSRSSTRSFVYKKIGEETIRNIIECGQWAPSDKNNQPWKLCVVNHPTVKRMLAELTKDGGLVDSAYINLVVFFDLEKSSNRIRDIQSCGAFMENLLLGTHALKLGGVWISEILENKEKVNDIFKLRHDQFELMGVIAIGVIDEEMEKKKKVTRERREIDEFIDWF